MLDEAAREFRRVAELRPDDIGARFFLGLAQLRLGRWAEALTHLEAASRQRGAKAAVFHNLGLALERLGRLDDARAALEQALTRGGEEEPRIHISLGILALREGRFEDADAHFMRARPLFGTKPPSAVWFHSAGLAAGLSGQLDKAVALLSEGTQAHPHAAALHNNLAVALASAGRPAEALAAIDRGITEDAGLASLHRNRGDILLAQGQGDQALEEYLRAVKHHETLGPEVWSRIGDLRAGHGEQVEATAAWEKALVLDPSHASARARLDAAKRAG
jgi:tetratricopeptide (TPR) repeat protein